jgi:hypothetical protein
MQIHKYRWNLEDMYPDESQWKADYQEALLMAKEDNGYQGKVCLFRYYPIGNSRKKKIRIWQRRRR